jgi:hypothetical protein
MSNTFELSALARDCFVVLHRAKRIEYIGGDAWQLEEGDPEHPLVPRLRVASMVSIMNERPADGEDVETDDTQHLLREERKANDKMRAYLRRLEDLCEEKGMPKGDDPIKWLTAAIG